MNGTYSKFIEMMRSEGAVYNPTGLQLAEMTSPDSCKIGDLPLYKEDLVFAENLLYPVCTSVSVSGEEHSDNSSYISPLKAGDTVIIQKMSDSLYAVLGKVIRI